MLMILTLTPATSFAASVDYSSLLSSSWIEDQDFRLADPAPWNIDELKQVVDVSDPRSVAAYWAWSITRMVDDYDDGIEMLRYLYADLEPFGRGFTEGGAGGKQAGAHT